MIGVTTVNFAQSFSVYKMDVNSIVTATLNNGGSIYEATTANLQTSTKIKIKNNAASTQTFNVIRTVVFQSPTLDLSAVPNNPTTYFCFGNNCFTPPVATAGPSDYTILAASGQTSTTFPTADNSKDNNQPFSIYLEEGPTTGGYIVKYKVFNVANANDTSVFYIGYNTTVGIKNIDLTSLSFNIYPNPANNEATVFVNSINSADVKLSVTNSLGQLIYTKQQNLNATSGNINLDCKNLAAGIYIIIVESDKNTETKKLVISK